MTKKSIETSDIILAATLKVKGFKLDKIEKQGSRGIFCFSEVDIVFLKYKNPVGIITKNSLIERDIDILTEFDLGKCLVEPVAFNNSVKSLTTATRRII